MPPFVYTQQQHHAQPSHANQSAPGDRQSAGRKPKPVTLADVKFTDAQGRKLRKWMPKIFHRP